MGCLLTKDAHEKEHIVLAIERAVPADHDVKTDIWVPIIRGVTQELASMR